MPQASSSNKSKKKYSIRQNIENKMNSKKRQVLLKWLCPLIFTRCKLCSQTSRQILHSNDIPALLCVVPLHRTCLSWPFRKRIVELSMLTQDTTVPWKHTVTVGSATLGRWIRGSRQLCGHNGSLTYKDLKGRTNSEVGTVTAATSAYAAYVYVVFTCIYPPRQ